MRSRLRYKAAGAQAMDSRGTRDVTECFNISKDDAAAIAKKFDGVATVEIK